MKKPIVFVWDIEWWPIAYLEPVSEYSSVKDANSIYQVVELPNEQAKRFETFLKYAKEYFFEIFEKVDPYNKNDLLARIEQADKLLKKLKKEL